MESIKNYGNEKVYQLPIGDFGKRKRIVNKTQIVGIYDLVGFSSLNSNRELVSTVKIMETQIELVLSPRFTWGATTIEGEEPENDIWLSSTGDGYIVAFSQGMNDFEALKILTEIHSAIRKRNGVKLGINRGENYLINDLNDRVNLVGWGINLAARALDFAQTNQIICTEYFSKPLFNTYGDKINGEIMIDVGIQTIKTSKLRLYNYYSNGKFGASLTSEQKNNRTAK